MTTRWNCHICGWTTDDNTIEECPDCFIQLVIIPEKLDNTLFVGIHGVIFFYDLYCILNDQNDAVELFTFHDEHVYTVRNWQDFKYFFGKFFYIRYAPEICWDCEEDCDNCVHSLDSVPVRKICWNCEEKCGDCSHSLNAE